MMVRVTMSPRTPHRLFRPANIYRRKEIRRSNLLDIEKNQEFDYFLLRKLHSLNIMQLLTTFRCALQPTFAALLLSASVGMAQPAPPGPPKGGFSARPPAAQARGGPRPQNQEHLAQWMDRHSNLSLPQQHRALQSEPGFNNLPAQTQQRMLDHLSHLNNMPPEQRRRTLERNEALEHLTPAQRGQVRGAMQQLGGLPVDRRRLVARAFRDLREMPQPQRQAILNQDRFRTQFSDQERTTLSNLLAVEPYLPVQRQNEAPEAGR
jgi:hypothetical protein